MRPFTGELAEALEHAPEQALGRAAGPGQSLVEAGGAEHLPALVAGLGDAVGVEEHGVAGHNPPRLRRCGERTVEPLDGVGGLPLGIADDETYAERTIGVSRGDSMLFYTDGITEARNAAGGMYGTERLDEAMICGSQTAAELLECVLSNLRQFTGTIPQGDDQTLLAAIVR